MGHRLGLRCGAAEGGQDSGQSVFFLSGVRNKNRDLTLCVHQCLVPALSVKLANQTRCRMNPHRRVTHTVISGVFVRELKAFCISACPLSYRCSVCDCSKTQCVCVCVLKTPFCTMLPWKLGEVNTELRFASCPQQVKGSSSSVHTHT